MNRDVVCQLLPEAGHPPYIAARLKKLAKSMNDAPPTLEHVSKGTAAMARADWCCYVLYPAQSRSWKHWGQSTIAQQRGTEDVLIGLRERPEMDAAFEKQKKRWVP